MSIPQILNKLKLLGIKNRWQTTIIDILAKKKGCSARFEPLYEQVRKKLKEIPSSKTRGRFNQQLSKLLDAKLLKEQMTPNGNRQIKLIREIWTLDDSLLEAINQCTIESSIGRKNNIKAETLLKDVRSKLKGYDISTKRVTTRNLVFYFLEKRCGWKKFNNEIIPPVVAIAKKHAPVEHQQDLFT